MHQRIKHMKTSLEYKMKLARTSSRLGLAALAVVACPLAMADEPGWYGGLGAGQSRALMDDRRIASGLLGSGLTASSIDDTDRDNAYKLFGGYQFNRNFALEGGYFDLGKFGFKATTVPAGTLTGTIRVQGLNLDAVGILPFTEKFSAFGRVGATYAETKDTFSGTGAVGVTNPNPTKSDTNYKYGVGLQYDVTQALALRLEAERYRINDAVGNRGDVDMVTVGLLFRFGGKTQERVAPEPAPVAQAAQPEPPAPLPVVVPPPARVLTKVSLSVDSDFDFDKISLKDSAKKVLDKLVADLRGVNYDRVTVTGNTDRIGTEAYNMKLSLQRAEMVRNYLVIRWGIPSDKVVMVGAGETNPETLPGECRNEATSKSLIQCLAPDRRVDIEVHGTK